MLPLLDPLLEISLFLAKGSHLTIPCKPRVTIGAQNLHFRISENAFRASVKNGKSLPCAAHCWWCCNRQRYVTNRKSTLLLFVWVRVLLEETEESNWCCMSQSREGEGQISGIGVFFGGGWVEFN